jgi:acyl phosphate:glycerol-3-phosphate acyltransferase
MILIQLFIIAVIGYLWGSIPPGYWMGKLVRGTNFDIRTHGSHKTGATNVLRTLGPVPAAIVLIFDLSKGVGPVLLATFVPFFFGLGWGPTVAGLAALIGHCFPIFIGFRGGRGVLTGAGAILIISPLSFAAIAVTALSTIAITRYVSLGSLVGCLTSIVCGVLFFIIGHVDPSFFGKVSLPQLVFLVVGPLLVILLHADNIARLRAGTERKIGQKEDAEEQPSAPDESSKVQA